MAGEMIDRITHQINLAGIECIDEIAFTGADIHLEMMDEQSCFVSIIKDGTEHRFWLGIEKRSLVMKLQETIYSKKETEP